MGLEDIFNPSKFSDTTVYFVMGAVGSALFFIRLLLMLIVGMDDGGDFDTDVDTGGDVEIHASGFSLFSMLSIVAFLMGAGWLGFAARTEWGLGSIVSALCASAFGFGLMLFSSFGMYKMKQLNEVGHYDVRTCVNMLGRVYLKIPAQGQGQGQVEINVDGRRKVLSAVSKGDEIESFASVKVVGVESDETLVVEPH